MSLFHPEGVNERNVQKWLAKRGMENIGLHDARVGNNSREVEENRRLVDEACERWLRARGKGTMGLRQQITNEINNAKR